MTSQAASPTRYESLKGKSRDQIVAIAREEVLKVLKSVDLADYRSIAVTKTSKLFRVRFSSNVGPASEGLGSPKQSTIQFTSMATVDEVRPKDSNQLVTLTPELREISKMFRDDDQLSIRDRGSFWEVGASHKGGGWEQYSVDKKTKERKMTQHEHPQSHGAGSQDLSEPGETDPEVEIL